MKKEKYTAIVPAAGQGKRMGTQVQKQFLDLGEGKPILYYSLNVFQKSPLIDEIILVVSQNEITFCQKEIVEKYRLDKVAKIVPGGKERQDSVYQGLKQCTDADYVLIHDGARPFVTEKILQRVVEAVQMHKACAVGVPAKDTVKLLDAQGFVRETPDRSQTWLVQTPQAFAYPLIRKAHEFIRRQQAEAVTDDAAAVERSGLARVKMVLGDYFNLKITTPEDLETAKGFFRIL